MSLTTSSRYVRRAAAAGVAVLSIACTRGKSSIDAAPRFERAARWIDVSGHTNGLVDVGDARLHYIDYGGRGPALVFLAGLGNSAHVFDEFAPRFTDRYRVLSITRRGYGQSSQPTAGYDTRRLGADIVAVLDSLGIDRAILAGHSVAGDELTEVAARSPQRVVALVYLDAAYDRSSTTKRLLTLAVTKRLPPAPPKPSHRERSSPDEYRAYLARIYGVRWPLAEVLATRQFDSAGRYVRDVSRSRTNLAVLRGETPLDYAHVRAPVLSIYAVERGLEQDYRWVTSLGVGRGKAELQARNAMRADREWSADERTRLRRALPGARVVEIPRASHYVFLSHADRVEDEMRQFLAAVEP